MAYEKLDWENLPTRKTPITAARLAHMETQYDEAVTLVQRSQEELDAKLAMLSSQSASVDELLASIRVDTNYLTTSPSFEITGTTVFSVLSAPFDFEITDVSLTFERLSIERDPGNYLRAWPTLLRPGDSPFPISEVKSTTANSGGEAIAARKPWSLSAGGIHPHRFTRDDVLAVVIGKTGTPPPILLPVVVTVKYRPL